MAKIVLVATLMLSLAVSSCTVRKRTVVVEKPPVRTEKERTIIVH